MAGKQLERLVSNGKKWSANKSFICYVDEKKGKEVLVFKFGGVYLLDGRGEVEKLKYPSEANKPINPSRQICWPSIIAILILLIFSATIFLPFRLNHFLN